MADVILTRSWLEIDGYPLATHAVLITSLRPLLGGANQRGADRLLPLAGVRSLPRRDGSTTYSLQTIVSGERDRAAVARADPIAGLDVAIDELYSNVLNPPGGTTGTRTGIWHKANGSTVTKALTVLPFQVREFSPTSIRGVLSFTIPNGRFT